MGVKADVTSERDVNDLFCRTLEKFTRLDVLVNNAGFAWPRGGPVNLELAETPLDVWRKILDTNLNGTFLCSREALKIMRPQRSGAIINISSPQGKKGKLLRGAYSAAKFGVEGLTQVLALENEAYNIRANCLDPGGIVATEAIKNIPGNRGVRMLSPEIVRACAVYLASDESSGITGQSFVATEWNKQHGFEVPYTVARSKMRERVDNEISPGPLFQRGRSSQDRKEVRGLMRVNHGKYYFCVANLSL